MLFETSDAPEDGMLEAVTVTRAVIAAAERLGLSARQLSVILGLSEASLSRMKRLEFRLERGTKPFELGLLLIRLFRALDAVTGGDELVARAWLKNGNSVLGGIPAERMSTVAGLVDVLAYLDARRALV
ncbi:MULTISPECIES: MbcA/ParS/Xre antitoxin family protein [unclassified Rhizobium]|uniref:MbcA/ParS/Xre antitoxin family protein n=1 Tax=unclassified Rhizobium TaxID=2613769 RepID=UPI00024E357F|nr:MULTISPECIES: MbcA/ParS/Xre antitoxin family protein [unclassified Rhizobium]EHS52738.1 hypothetical protein PDO_1324 [Rhizobium sp. PDO1-076]